MVYWVPFVFFLYFTCCVYVWKCVMCLWSSEDQRDLLAIITHFSSLLISFQVMSLWCFITCHCLCITNILGFIGSYKFHAKFGLHRFLQKSHEFHVIGNMNNIYTYWILKIQMNETSFLNGIREFSYLIHINCIDLCKIISW